MSRFWATAIAPWRERTGEGSKSYVRLGQAWRAFAFGNGLLFLALWLHIGLELVNLLGDLDESAGDPEFGRTFSFFAVVAVVGYVVILLAGSVVFLLLAHVIGRGFRSWRQRNATSPGQTRIAAACALAAGFGLLAVVRPEFFPFTEGALVALADPWVDVGLYLFAVGMWALIGSSRPAVRGEFSPSAPPPMPRL